MKKVKKLSALFLAMVMLFALVACGADPAADAGNEAENTNPDAENLVIKMGHAESDNENSCHHMADTKFAELVNEYSDGRITIEVFANGQLGGERDMVEGLQIGTVDMCSVANLSLSGFDESFGVFDLPYFFDTAEDAYKILDSEYFNDVMCPALAEKTGIRILGVGVGGYRNIACNKTITSIDDFNSLKIRVPQNRPRHLCQWRCTGIYRCGRISPLRTGGTSVPPDHGLPLRGADRRSRCSQAGG